MLNEDFNIDQFKKSWQEQPVSDVYNTSEIEGMLNKKSTNYVKYIFWISLAEFLFFAIVGICTIFSTQRSNSFTNILEKLGVQMNDDVEMNFEHLYFALKVFSLLITAIFVFLFYRNYLKIKVECNLKNFILQIIKFKRTVNLFIFTNIGLLIIFSGVSLYTPFTHPEIAQRWFSLPNLYYFSPVPILVLLFVGLILSACKKQHELKPFIYTLALVFLAFTGFVISLWPNIIPPSVTIWQAAAPESSLKFTLVGAAILIPIIIAYTFLSYWVFRDKVRIGDQGYH